jgi:Folate-dependent phosphoribosylglycinamide formyltransferase PurN
LLNIGWFSTGRDEAARQLLQAVQESIRAGEIEGKSSFVFSNRESGESKESDSFLELVRSYNIPLICFSHRRFKSGLLRFARNDRIECRNEKTGDHNDITPTGEQKDWRLKYDREVVKRIEKFTPDICVLAGYMLIIGEELCKKCNMINLHPALPGGPVGSWQDVIWALIQNKAEEAGAMMHLITPELDRGPVVSYCAFPIKGEPFNQYWQKNDKDILFKLIRQHELIREFPLIIATLKAFSQGKIAMQGGKVVDAQGDSINGYNLTEEINLAVEGKIDSLHSQ